MRELAALGGFRAELDLADLDRRRSGAEVFDLELFRRQGDDIIIVQVNHLACVGDDGTGVAGEKVFPSANPDNQRRSAPRAYDEVWAVRAEHGDAVGADDLLERFHDGLGQRRQAIWILARAA